jgi:predicted Zn-dependent protease
MEDPYLKQLVELRKQLDEALRGSKENANWFDSLKIDYDIIKKQLDIAVEAIKKAREHYYEDGIDGGYYILKDALAEIEGIRKNE